MSGQPKKGGQLKPIDLAKAKKELRDEFNLKFKNIDSQFHALNNEVDMLGERIGRGGRRKRTRGKLRAKSRAKSRKKRGRGIDWGSGVLKDIALNDIKVGQRYTVTITSYQALFPTGSFRGTFERISLHSNGGRHFHFSTTTTELPRPNAPVSVSIPEGELQKVQQYTIAPHGDPYLAEKINVLVGGRRKKSTKKRGGRKKRRKSRRKSRRRKNLKKRTKRRR